MERIRCLDLTWVAPSNVARHLAGDVRGLAVLDFGCGGGELLERLPGAGRRVGVDVSREALARCAERVHPRPMLAQIGPRGPLPFAPDSFDLVVTTEVIEHVPDDRAALRQLWEVLRPGGRLILTTPHRHRFSALDLGNLKFRCPRLHACYWLALRRMSRDQYARRFLGVEGMIGDISVQERPWHRHYRLEDLQELTRGLFDVEQVFIYGPWERLIKPFLLLTRRWLPPLARLLFKMDQRSRREFHDQGYDICVVGRKPMGQRAHPTMES